MTATDAHAKFRRTRYVNTALAGRMLPEGYLDWDACPEALKDAWRASVQPHEGENVPDIAKIIHAARLENAARHAEIDNLRWIMGITGE
jgi:hypothetical protein